MKRFYLSHQSTWSDEVQFFHNSGPLSDSFQGKGCVWFDLPDGWRIISGDFVSEDREDAWNSHPGVVHLHHPVKEKSLPLGHLLNEEHAHKRFTSAHLDLLKSIGVDENDTLEHLNTKLAAFHPGCTIYPISSKSPRWIY